MNGKVWYKTAALERSAARSRMGYAPVAGFEKLGEDRYVANVTRHALRVLAIIGLQIQSGLTEAKSHETVAISATATGNDQWVGFRALVMKQAIAYNLAGTAKNNPNNVVEFTLQGRSKRIDKAVETIRNGTRKSSNIEVKTAHWN